MSDPVVLYAEFTARPDRRADVERLILLLAEQVRREPGNQEFTVYQTQGDACQFFVFERYADQAAFRTHVAAAHSAEFNAALADLILEDGSQLTFLRATAP